MKKKTSLIIEDNVVKIEGLGHLSFNEKMENPLLKQVKKAKIKFLRTPGRALGIHGKFSSTAVTTSPKTALSTILHVIKFCQFGERLFTGQTV